MIFVNAVPSLHQPCDYQSSDLAQNCFDYLQAPPSCTLEWIDCLRPLACLRSIAWSVAGLMF